MDVVADGRPDLNGAVAGRPATEKAVQIQLRRSNCLEDDGNFAGNLNNSVHKIRIEFSH